MYTTLSNAFQLPPAVERGPGRKYISRISEANRLGQTRGKIKYTLRHLIWQLSFQASTQRSTQLTRRQDGRVLSGGRGPWVLVFHQSYEQIAGV